MINQMIVGLGNPGKKYKKTRHNIGFVALDSYAKIKKLKFKKSLKFNSEIIEYKNTVLIKPRTYMNNSGLAVQKASNYYKITPENILIIHDDVDLFFGKIKLKKNGGSGGHNGIKSIINYLTSDNFKRLKFGIDKDDKIDTKDYVLKEWNKNEEMQLNDIVITINDIIDQYIDEVDFNTIMNKYN